ncbi:MAG: hypothetical protein LUF29_04655 [Oscillospiraceae bacterium]|nr:hypothetical protein [Oscillospiraceae bacterium]
MNLKFKSILSVIIALSMVFMLSGCAESVSDSDSDSSVTDSAVGAAFLISSTLSGTVIEVSGYEIVLSVALSSGNSDMMGMGGDMQMGDMNGMGGEGGDVPSDVPSDNGQGGGDGEGGDKPDDIPSDDGQGGGDGGDAPDKPDGEGGEGRAEPTSSTGDYEIELLADTEKATEPEESSDITFTVSLIVMDESIITDSDGNSLTLSDIEAGDTLTFTVDDCGEITSIIVGSEASDMGNLSNGGGMGGGSSSGVDSYDAVVTYTEDGTYSNMDYTSTGSDENAVLVTSGDVTISDSTISRISSDSTGGDNSSFYGVGASALVTSGTLRITNTTIASDSAGGAGVFAYGDGVAYVSDTEITTEQDTSGGIHVAGGGTLYAWNLTVSTSGESSAAIRSDRGSGTMVVDGGTYTSNGTGSPAVYSTADITVANATLTANSSEAICIEGLNSIRLFDCDLSGSMKDSSQNDCTWNVIVYQSMSGDSEVGNGNFYMIGGTLTANNGGMFYTTNTESTFLISGVDITYAEDSEFFLKCTGNSNQRGWGSTGSNGADCSFTAILQEMEGAVIYDSISNLDFYMLEGSVLTGYFVDDESNAGSGGNGECNVYIDSTSTWVVTNYSTVTNLYCEGTIVDEDGKTVTILSSDGTVYVTGDSTYTITVETYSETADTTGASTLISFDDYSVDNPF